MSYPHLLPKGFTAVTKPNTSPLSNSTPISPNPLYAPYPPIPHTINNNQQQNHQNHPINSTNATITNNTNTTHHHHHHQQQQPAHPHHVSGHLSHARHHPSSTSRSPVVPSSSVAPYSHVGYSYRNPTTPPPIHAHSHANLESAVALATAAAQAAQEKEKEKDKHQQQHRKLSATENPTPQTAAISSSLSPVASSVPSPLPVSSTSPQSHPISSPHFPSSSSSSFLDHPPVIEEAPNEALLEAEHFIDVIYHIEMYATHTFQKFERLSRDFHCIDPALQRLIPSYDQKMSDIRAAVLTNFNFLRLVTSHRYAFQNDDTINYAFLENKRLALGRMDEEKMSKVRSTLRQCVRDWSKEGEKERHMCYTPILKELERLFPLERVSRNEIRVLVPGSGLGRLTWEIANMGFYSQGNEFSYFMLVTSFLLLNHCQQPFQFSIFPYIHETKNVMRSEDMLRNVRIPDVEVTSLAGDGRFSMVAGDFMDVYSEEGREYREKEKEMKQRSDKGESEDRWKVQHHQQHQHQHQQQDEQHSHSKQPRRQSTERYQGSSSLSSEEGGASDSIAFHEKSMDEGKELNSSPIGAITSSKPRSSSSSSSASRTTMDMEPDSNHEREKESKENESHSIPDVTAPTESSDLAASPASSSSTSSSPSSTSSFPSSNTNKTNADENESSDEDDDDLSTSNSSHSSHLTDPHSTLHQKENWDCVTTCYFLDCSNNILEFIRTISYLLKPNGYWINFGPLLYHYADMADEMSIELSYDEIKSTFPAFGLKLIQEKTNRQSGYTVDEKSMMRTYYYAVEFTCQKVGGDTTRGERAAQTKKKTRRGKGRKAREKEERRKVKLAEEAAISMPIPVNGINVMNAYS